MKNSGRILILLIMCLILSSCQSGLSPEQLRLQEFNNINGNEQDEADYDILDNGPVTGGTLNLFSTKPDTLNPILTKNTYTSDFLGFIYEGLTRLDEKQRAVPYLSDSWTVSGDGLIWNFHIRDGVKWQDGQAFTSSDVEFTIQSLLNPGLDSVYKPLLLNIATCAAVDSSNIRIVLLKPNSFMPEMMTFPILQKNQFKGKDILTASQNFNPVGTGPYKFISYNSDKQMVLQVNKNWWYLDEEGNSAADGMFIEKINVNVFNKPDDALGAFQTGEVDAVSIKSGDFSKYRGRTDLIIKRYTSRDFEFLALNQHNPVLTDEFARKAISASINRDNLIAEVLPGDAESAELPVISGSWISSQGNESSMTTAEGPKPSEILKNGGWTESKDGYYKSINGVRRYLKVEIIVNSNNNIRVRAAQQISSQLASVGIPAICTPLEWKDVQNRINTSKYEIAFAGCRVPQIPDLSYLYSSNYFPASLPAQNDIAHNISGYSNLQVDSKIRSIFIVNEDEIRKSLYMSIKEQVLNDSPYIGLYFLRSAMIYSRNLRGPLTPETWNRYKDIYHWYKPKLP